MVSFIVYDLIFMSLFFLFIIIFSLKKKENWSRQGIMFLYKTQFGVKFIDSVARKYEKILKPMRYLVLTSGYVLTIVIVWLMARITYLYLTTPIARYLKAPPIAPLIPYFPAIFGLESFFPPLFFTYFIISLGIVIIAHEGAHGIFARLEKFRVHSTGFAFLGPIPGAFVEPDEKQMRKAKRFPQLSVLAAGTFANVILTIIFGAIMLLYFSSLFTPAGVIFNSYSLSLISAGDISVIGPSEIEGFSEIESYRFVVQDGELAVERSNGKERFFINDESLNIIGEGGAGAVFAIDNSPAFHEKIPVNSAITKIDGKKVTNRDDLSEVLASYLPGEKVEVAVDILNPGQGTVAERKNFEVELGEHEGKAFLGVGFLQGQPGIMRSILDKTVSKVKEPNTHYESKIGNFGWFVYYLLWWIVVINVAVALFNMLPLAILDGGRFFQLTVESVTGSEKIGLKAFKFATWFILLVFAVLMVKWASVFF